MSRRKQSRPKHVQEVDEDFLPTVNHVGESRDDAHDTTCSSAEDQEEPHLTPKCFQKFADLSYYGSVLQMQEERISIPESSTSRMEDIHNSEVKIGICRAEDEVGQQVGLRCHHQKAREESLGRKCESEQVRSIPEVFNIDFLPRDQEDQDLDLCELNESLGTDNLENERELNYSDYDVSNEQQTMRSRKQMPLRLEPISASITPYATATDTNVKLASICSTDVAVAQITENNTLPVDLALLHTVLWNLKQQQFFQMHLLQQLHNQLMQSAGNLSSRPVTPIIVPTSMSCSPVMKESTLGTSDNLESNASTGSLINDTQSGLMDADSVLNDVICNDNLDPDENKFQINSTQSPTKQRTPMLAMMDMSTSYLGLLQEQILLNEKESRPDNNCIKTSAHNSLLPITDESFFKHKCRYCQKVFTSDSALQIHIRSHTGERPYRCNICGNRFSTKGNLKVHFMCHTEKYSNIHIGCSQDATVAPDILQGMIPSATFTWNRFNAHPPTLVPTKHNTSTSSSNGFGSGITNPLPTSFQLQPKAKSGQHPSGDTLKSNPLLIQCHKDFMVNGGSSWVEPPVSNTPVSSTSDAAQNRSLEDPQLIEMLVTQEESPEKTSKLSMEIASVIVCSSSSSSSMTQLPPSPQPPVTTPLLPLSLLSSMSTSLSAFTSQPFSSSFSVHGATIATNLTSPHAPLPPFDFDSSSVYFRRSSPHSRCEDPLEQFMEVQKSETSKMEQLVNNIDKKLTDPNQCVICYRTLSCKSALQMHYRTHTGERPFRCKICGRAFTTKGNLKTHMGVHRAKPPVRMMHQCPVCHKQFTNALVLQQHIRMHTGELPKQVPFPNSMMIVPSTMNYIPFPGYPFFTPRFHQIRRPALIPPQLHLSLHSQLGPRSPFLNPMVEPEQGMKGYLTMSSTETEKRQLSTSALSIDALKASSSKMKYRDSHDDYRSSKQTAQTKDMYMETESDYADAAVSTVNSSSVNLSDIKDDNDAGEEAANCQDITISNQRSTVLCVHQSRSTPLPNYLHNAVTEEKEDEKEEQREKKGGTKISSEGYGHRIDSSEAQDQTKTTLKQRLNNNQILKTHSRYLMIDPPQNCYSASLMALEEKVMEINVQQHSINTGANHSLEQIERIIRRTECLSPSHVLQKQDSIYNIQTTNSNYIKQAEDCQQSSMINKNCIMSPNHIDKLDFELIPAGNQFPCQAPLDPPLELSPQSFEAATGKANTTCSICYKTFACKSALDIHYRSHTKERPFKCKLCDRAFSTKGNMKQHMMTHKGNTEEPTNPVVFSSEGSCSSCSHSSPTEDRLHISKSLSESERVVSETSFRSNKGAHDEFVSNILEGISHRPSYDIHKPKLSTGTDEAAAHSCHSPTQSRKSNFRHLCQVCQKPFSSASALQIHMRTHTGDKPFKCTVCSKAFTTKGNLKVHTGTHTWNNGPSRRGRRMSVEGFASLAPPSKCSSFFGTPQRLPPPPSHDLYPFSFPGFSNSFGGSKLNEISVIQSISSRIAHLSPASSNDIITAHLPPLMKSHPYILHRLSQTLPSSHVDSLLTYHLNSATSVENNARVDNRLEKSDNQQCGDNGELDLSFKKSIIPSMLSTSEMVRNPSWAWKTSCNHCSIVCSSPGALELHMKTHSEWLDEDNSPTPLMT